MCIYICIHKYIYMYTYIYIYIYVFTHISIYICIPGLERVQLSVRERRAARWNAVVRNRALPGPSPLSPWTRLMYIRVCGTRGRLDSICVHHH